MYLETSNKVLKGKSYIKDGKVFPATQIIREYESFDEMNDDIEMMNRQNFEVVKKLHFDIFNFLVIYVNKNTK